MIIRIGMVRSDRFQYHSSFVGYSYRWSLDCSSMRLSWSQAPLLTPVRARGETILCIEFIPWMNLCVFVLLMRSNSPFLLCSTRFWHCRSPAYLLERHSERWLYFHTFCRWPCQPNLLSMEASKRDSHNKFESAFRSSTLACRSSLLQKRLVDTKSVWAGDMSMIWTTAMFWLHRKTNATSVHS